MIKGHIMAGETITCVDTVFINNDFYYLFKTEYVVIKFWHVHMRHFSHYWAWVGPGIRRSHGGLRESPLISLASHLSSHLRSPRLLCVRSLGSQWYDYVYFNSVSSSIQWVVSLLQWLTKLSVLNVSHYATMNNKTSVKPKWSCFKSGTVIGSIKSVRVQSD